MAKLAVSSARPVPVPPFGASSMISSSLSLFCVCLSSRSRRPYRHCYTSFCPCLRWRGCTDLEFFQLPMALVEPTRHKHYPMGLDAECSRSVLRSEWSQHGKDYVWLDIFSIPHFHFCLFEFRVCIASAWLNCMLLFESELTVSFPASARKRRPASWSCEVSLLIDTLLRVAS